MRGVAVDLGLLTLGVGAEVGQLALPRFLPALAGPSNRSDVPRYSWIKRASRAARLVRWRTATARVTGSSPPRSSGRAPPCAWTL